MRHAQSSRRPPAAWCRTSKPEGTGTVMEGVAGGGIGGSSSLGHERAAPAFRGCSLGQGDHSTTSSARAGGVAEPEAGCVIGRCEAIALPPGAMGGGKNQLPYSVRNVSAQASRKRRSHRSGKTPPQPTPTDRTGSIKRRSRRAVWVSRASEKQHPSCQPSAPVAAAESPRYNVHAERRLLQVGPRVRGACSESPLLIQRNMCWIGATHAS